MKVATTSVQRRGCCTHETWQSEEIYILDFGTSEASECVSPIRSSDQASLSEVVLRLQVPDLGLVRPIDDSDRN